MPVKTPMKSIEPLNPKIFSAKIAILYAIISICWILFSDYLLELLLPHVEQIMMVGTIKGLAFVCFTAVFLFMILQRETKRYMNAYDTLKENERTIRMTMEATNTGTWTWDMVTNKTDWSDENYRLLGYEPGSVESNYDNWKKAVHPDDWPAIEKRLEQATQKKSDINFEYRVRWPDGTVRWLQDIGKLVVDESGTPTGMYGIQIDITERKRTEESHEKLENSCNRRRKWRPLANWPEGWPMITTTCSV